MRFTLKTAGVIVNIVEGDEGYTNPDFDVSDFVVGDKIFDLLSGTFQKEITFSEFMGFFPSDQWVEVEELVEGNATGRRILGWMEKPKKSFSIENPEVVMLINAIGTFTSVGAARASEIKQGIPL